MIALDARGRLYLQRGHELHLQKIRELFYTIVDGGDERGLRREGLREAGFGQRVDRGDRGGEIRAELDRQAPGARGLEQIVEAERARRGGRALEEDAHAEEVRAEVLL